MLSSRSNDDGVSVVGVEGLGLCLTKSFDSGCYVRRYCSRMMMS